MTSVSPIPGEVRKFLYDHITSAAQMEVLLLLAGSPYTSWEVTEITVELRSQQDLVARALSDLEGAGLFARVGNANDGNLRYRYQPGNAALEKVVGTLAGLYSDRRHTILDLIYARRSPT